MTLSDSDSSSNDDLQKFKESVDQQFLKDELYTENFKKDTLPNQNKNKILPSLRRNIHEEDEALNFFRVTPEFQKYVAKHLSLKLEKELNELENVSSNKAILPSYDNKKKKKGGIKLLHSSTHKLKVPRLSFADVCGHNRICMKKQTDFDEDTLERRCKQVAVNVDDILSKKDVKLWSNRCKKDVKCYKMMREGVLEYQPKPFVSIKYN